MIYLKVALAWCLVNFPVTFYAFMIDKNLFFSMIFLMGFGIILCFGLFEAYQKDHQYANTGGNEQ